MKPRSIVASLVATVLTVGALAPVAYAQSGSDQAPDAIGAQEVQAQVIDGAAAEDAFAEVPVVEDPLATEPVAEGSAIVVNPEDEGMTEPEPASDPQFEEQAAPNADGDETAVVAQFIPDTAVIECSDGTDEGAESTLAGAVENFVAGSHTVKVDIYLGDALVLSDTPNLDENGYFALPITDLTVTGEYRAEVQLLVEGEAYGEPEEALLNVYAEECEPPADAEAFIDFRRFLFDGHCDSKMSNTELIGNVANYDLLSQERNRILVTINGVDVALEIQDNATFRGDMGFFEPGVYTATLKLQSDYILWWHTVGDPKTVTFKVPPNGCPPYVIGNPLIQLTPLCVTRGGSADLMVTQFFTTPQEYKNYRFITTFSHAPKDTIKLWEGKRASEEQNYHHYFKQTFPAGTYSGVIRFQYDDGPFFYYSWEDMAPAYHFSFTVPTCGTSVGDAGTDVGAAGATGTPSGAIGAAISGKKPLAKTGASVLPVFLIGSAALAGGVVLRVRRGRRG